MAGRTLQPADEAKCSKCSRWHVCFQSEPDSTIPYVANMLYFQCGLDLYYVGRIGDQASQRWRPGRPLTADAKH